MFKLLDPVLLCPWQNALNIRTVPFFNSFFNSPSLIIKHFDKGLYGIGTAGMDRKRTPKIKSARQIKRGDHNYQFTDKDACCKWFDLRSVKKLFSYISGMQSTSNVRRRMKGSATKIPVPCPDVIKMDNPGMGGVDLVGQELTILIVNLQLDFIYVFFSI